MLDDLIVCVVTSEKTINNLQKYCFNDNFLINRKYFKLAMVINGKIEELPNIVKEASPDYLWQRPNLGYDLAGFDFVLKKLPLFKYYLLLHDDHWFVDKDWIKRLLELYFEYPNIGVWGNLFPADKYVPTDYEKFTSLFRLNNYMLDCGKYFLQGLAGFYKGEVIRDLIKYVDGIPHVHFNNREFTSIFERMHSLNITNLGYTIGQIPPGYEQYLKHNNW